MRPAEIADHERAAETMAAARATVPHSLDTTDIHDLLLGNLEHPHWETVAARCLGCANCTMVCPTCFCGTVTDELDLDGGTARRLRSWDSCFTLEFSYIHGGSIRQAGSARYRQWLTHKLASWFDQFGTSGCVGCGRCITWCPVGIDLVEEASALATEAVEAAAGDGPPGGGAAGDGAAMTVTDVLVRRRAGAAARVAGGSGAGSGNGPGVGR
jgi:sulfhydrogenase subunit beta (sulfur reductase)